MKKEGLKNYVIILIISLLIGFNFCRMHYALDTYSLLGSGFEAYSKFFLRSGRFVASALWMILGIFKVPINVAIPIMGVGSLMLLSYTAYILYNEVKKYIDKDKVKQSIILILSFTYVFNFMGLQNLVYAENIVMSLGIFLVVKSAVMLNKKEIKNYIFSTIILIIACASYQGIMNIFIPLVILFRALENKNDIKAFFKNIIKSFSLYVIALATNFIAMKIVAKLFFPNVSTRINGGIDLITNIIYPFKMLKDIIIYSKGMLYRYVFVIFLIISIIFIVYNIIKNENKKNNFIYFAFIVTSSYLACFVPMLVLSKDALDAPARLLFSVGAMIPLMFLFLIMFVKKINYKSIMYKMVIVWFIVNSINYIIVSTEHIIANKNDILETKKIIKLIDEYEEKNNIKITTIVSGYDKNPQLFYNGMILKNELDIKANYVLWQEATLINVFSNRAFEYKNMTDLDYQNIFKGKDFEEFNKEQVIFKNNIMYWCKY